MPGRGPRGSTGPGIRERDLGVRAPSRGDANDYCQHFVDTAQRPQNFLRDVHLVSHHACSANDLSRSYHSRTPLHLPLQSTKGFACAYYTDKFCH